MKSTMIALMILLSALIGCENFSPELSREQILPSGKRIKVLGVRFGFGAKDETTGMIANDSFTVEYLASNPNGNPKGNLTEALEVFELIRPVSEQWGLKEADVDAFPTPKKKGSYAHYHFQRSADGKWSPESMKGIVYS